MEANNIALFLHHLTIGGVQRTMLRLATELARRGHRVDLVLQTATGDLIQSVPSDVRVVDLAKGRMGAAILPLASYLRRERPLALLSGTCQANLAAVAAKRLARVDTRVYVREAAAPRTQYLHRLDDHRLRRVYRLIPQMYPWADGIIAPCEGVADELTAHFGLARDTIDVIYNPVVDNDVRTRAERPVDHPWLRNGGAPVILAVGRLDPQKDFETLLRAFTEVRRVRSAKLIVLGDGPLRSDLQVRARELGIEESVSMPGFVMDPYPWLARARAFVQTSLWEGFGNALVEAMACGTPVVSTDCPSGPSEILDGGRYGRLVPTHDAGAVAAALEATLDQPHDPNVLRQRASAFSITRSADRYEEVLVGATAVRA